MWGGGGLIGQRNASIASEQLGLMGELVTASLFTVTSLLIHRSVSFQAGHPFLENKSNNQIYSMSRNIFQ